MLEQLADYDDTLMEQLLSDQAPKPEQVFEDLAKELREGLICPVLLGSAHNGNGILRLMKALRHEVPMVDVTAARMKLGNPKSAARVLKTAHTAHGGKLSIARILTGTFADGATIFAGNGVEERIGGLFSMLGTETRRPAHPQPPAIPWLSADWSG